VSDDEYFRLVRDNLQERLGDFGPELIFWNWGYDGTIGEYGDMGLSPGLHARLTSEIKKLAEESCNGRLIVVLCGGSRRDLARFIIPQVIGMLVG
jgi:acetoin utilization deacetylase AcuC-like enzyme